MLAWILKPANLAFECREAYLLFEKEEMPPRWGQYSTYGRCVALCCVASWMPRLSNIQRCAKKYIGDIDIVISDTRPGGRKKFSLTVMMNGKLAAAIGYHI